MNQNLLAAVAGGAVVSVCHAQVFPDVIEMEIEASSHAEVRVPFDPLVAFESDFDDQLPDPSVDTEADVGGNSGEPRVYSLTDCQWRGTGSTNLSFDAQLDFLIDEPGFGSRTRVAAGSWSTRVVFELDRPANVHLSVEPSPFANVDYSDFEPGMLTGPDGVIVSGPPEPGLPSWIWVLDLAPGRYTFESFADYQVQVDDDASLDDRASHDVTISFRLPRCLPDLDGDGELTLFDFLAFQNLFASGDDRADFDGDGELTIFDFLAFQNVFDAGCD